MHPGRIFLFIFGFILLRTRISRVIKAEVSFTQRCVSDTSSFFGGIIAPCARFAASGFQPQDVEAPIPAVSAQRKSGTRSLWPALQNSLTE